MTENLPKPSDIQLIITGYYLYNKNNLSKI